MTPYSPRLWRSCGLRLQRSTVKIFKIPLLFNYPGEWMTYSNFTVKKDHTTVTHLRLLRWMTSMLLTTPLERANNDIASVHLAFIQFPSHSRLCHGPLRTCHNKAVYIRLCRSISCPPQTILGIFRLKQCLWKDYMRVGSAWWLKVTTTPQTYTTPILITKNHGVH